MRSALETFVIAIVSATNEKYGTVTHTQALNALTALKKCFVTISDITPTSNETPKPIGISLLLISSEG